MRSNDSGRGCAPLITDFSSTSRVYLFDEESQSYCHDAIENGLTRNLVPFGLATISEPPTSVGLVGNCRTFCGQALPVQRSIMLGPVDATWATTLNAGTWTMQAWVRQRAPTDTIKTILTFGGDNSSSASANNQLFTLQILNQVGNQFGNLALQTKNLGTYTTYDTGFRFPIYEWNLISVIRESGAFKVHINGQNVFTVIATLPGAGSSGRLSVGGKWSGASTIVQPFDGDVCGVYFQPSVKTETQIEDDWRRGFCWHGNTAIHYRAKVRGVSGFDGDVDLSDLYSQDFLKDFTIGDDIDAQIGTATVTLDREIELISLSPLVQSSIANNVTSQPPVYSPLLFVNREIELYSARAPRGLPPLSTDYMSKFLGKIDSVDSGSDEIKLECRDLTSVLLDSQIEAPNRISGDVGLEALMQGLLDQWDNTGFSNVFSSDPNLPLYAVPFTSFSTSYNPVTLFTPISSGVVIAEGFEQRVEPVLNALQTLANSIGGMCRWVYVDDPVNGNFGGNNGWRLSLIVPDRATQGVGCVIDLSQDVNQVNSAQINIQDVRTAIRGQWHTNEAPGVNSVVTGGDYEIASDIQHGIDSEGNRGIHTLEIRSLSGSNKYGRRTMILVEPSTSPIDTVAEMTVMLKGILDDLKEPDLFGNFDMLPFPEMEINTMAKIRADKLLWTSAQRLAVKSVSTNYALPSGTSVQLSGKPAAGRQRWMDMEARPGQGNPPPRNSLASLGDQMESSRNIGITSNVSRTMYNTGGKYFALKNPAFQSQTRGKGNMPDSWSTCTLNKSDINTNTVDTSLDITGGSYIYNSTPATAPFNVTIIPGASVSGLNIIRITDSDTTTSMRGIKSDFVPVDSNYLMDASWGSIGDFAQPLGLEVNAFKSVNSDIMSQIEIFVSWYDIDKNFISKMRLFVDGNAALSTDWAMHRVQSDRFLPVGFTQFYSTSTTRFARISIMPFSSGVPSVKSYDIDSVSFYKINRTVCASDSATPTWNANIAGVYNGDMRCSRGKYSGIPGDSFDRGKCFDSVNGFVRIKESGMYEISGQIIVDSDLAIAFAGGANNQSVSAVVSNGGVYSAVNGTRTAGVSVMTGPRAAIHGAGAPYQMTATVNGRVRLERGDTLTLDYQTFGVALAGANVIKNQGALSLENFFTVTFLGYE